MANSLNSLPLIIDTDLTSYRQSTGERQQGIRVTKLVLAVGAGGASSAGQVTITAPSDSATLYPPLSVASASPAYNILYVDNPDTNAALTWRDFAVTGVTATGTKLFIWWTV
jgi:hypothetical protein